MLLWTILALMTGAAVLALLWPLSRAASGPGRASDVEVYRAQLAEADRDREIGRLSETEAEAVKAEIGRRLLKAARQSTPDAAPAAADGRRRWAAVAVLVLVPAIALPLYLASGNPDLPALPVAERVRDPGPGDVAAMVARVEAHLAANPRDGRGWEVLAPVYVSLGRLDDAARARAQALELLGETAERQADLGEILYVRANGVVTAEALKAFARAAELSPGHPKATYFLALAAEQDGKPAEAAAILTRLIAATPADAPWLPILRESLARAERLAAAPASPAATAPGPGRDEIEAAAKLTPAERETMIRGMVDRLAERLKAEPTDLDGWLRLIRAYSVLGDGDRARAAIFDARRLFAADTAALARIETAARSLGLEG